MFLGFLNPHLLVWIRILLSKQAKKWRKTVISTVLLLLYDFLSFKNDVNVPSKRNKHVGLLVADEKSLIRRRIRIRIRLLKVVYGSEHPHPYQNVTDLEHCFLTFVSGAISESEQWNLQNIYTQVELRFSWGWEKQDGQGEGVHLPQQRCTGGSGRLSSAVILVSPYSLVRLDSLVSSVRLVILVSLVSRS